MFVVGAAVADVSVAVVGVAVAVVDVSDLLSHLVNFPGARYAVKNSDCILSFCSNSSQSASELFRRNILFEKRVSGNFKKLLIKYQYMAMELFM